MSKCVAEQFGERILSLELIDPNPGGKITITPLPTMSRQEIRLRLSKVLIDYARWAKELERTARLRKIELVEMGEKELEKMIANLSGNVEQTLPKRHYTDVAAERIVADYQLVQAGFALASRRLEKLNTEEDGKNKVQKPKKKPKR